MNIYYLWLNVNKLHYKHFHQANYVSINYIKIAPYVGHASSMPSGGLYLRCRFIQHQYRACVMTCTPIIKFSATLVCMVARRYRCPAGTIYKPALKACSIFDISEEVISRRLGIARGETIAYKPSSTLKYQALAPSRSIARREIIRVEWNGDLLAVCLAAARLIIKK